MDEDKLAEYLAEEPSEATEAPEVEAAPEPEIEATEKPRDEQGRFAKTGEEGASPAPSTEPALDHAAIVAERRRRQEAEQRATALEQQLQALQSPPPSIWEDEAGAFQHNNQQVVNQAVQQATFNAKLDMSEMMVRQANPDFEDVKAEFLALAEANPTLAQQALNDPHPWNKAYTIAKNHRAMQDLGATDVADLEAKLREKIMAEMATGIPAPKPKFTSLTTERNVASRGGPEWTPPTLEDYLR